MSGLNEKKDFPGGTVLKHLASNVPISRYALDKNPMPGHLFEGNPVDEDTTQRGTDTLVGYKALVVGWYEAVNST